MKKLVIGIIIGAVLSFSGQALAETVSKVGKKIQNEYTVVVNGKTLDKKALAVDGSSYTPNRVLADALGLDISFENNTVYFKEASTVDEESVPDLSNNVPAESGISLEMVNSNLDALNLTLKYLLSSYERTDTDDAKKVVEERIASVKAQIEKFNQMKAQLEAQQ